MSLPWALLSWMAGVCVLSMRMLLGFIGMYRWQQHRESLPEHLLPSIAKLAHRLGLRNFDRVFISPLAQQPVEKARSTKTGPFPAYLR